MKIFDLSTFKGRLLTGFAVLGLLNIAFLVILLSFSKGILSEGTKVVQVYQPIELKLAEIARDLNEGELIVKDDELSVTQKQNKVETLFNNRLKPELDFLLATALKWENDEAQTQLKTIAQSVKSAEKLIVKAIQEQERLKQAQREANGFFVSNFNKSAQEYKQASADFSAASQLIKNDITQAILLSSNNVNTQQNLLQVVLALILLSTLGFGLLFTLSFSKRFNNAIAHLSDYLNKLSTGDFPDLVTKSKDEFGVLAEKINVLVANLKNVKEFALEVGQGNFETNISVFNNQGELGSSLAGMRTSLQTVSDNDRKRNWSTKGLAEFSNILRQSDKNLKEMSYEIISNLVKYLGANQGGIFILEKEGDGGINDAVLNLEACYAYERRKFKEAQVAVGEGLIGQCVLEGETIFMTDIPENYVRITSGLGEATPRSIIIVPLKVNEEIFGVVEIASFHQFEEYQIKFVEELGESIASTISGVKVNERTARLLEESQRQSEAMRAQEEEMRQNMEELQATQEEMERKNKEIERIREVEKKRADEEVERLNEVMSDYMNNFHNEKKKLQDKIQQLEQQLSSKS